MVLNPNFSTLELHRGINSEFIRVLLPHDMGHFEAISPERALLRGTQGTAYPGFSLLLSPSSPTS